MGSKSGRPSRLVWWREGRLFLWGVGAVTGLGLRGSDCRGGGPEAARTGTVLRLGAVGLEETEDGLVVELGICHGGAAVAS